VEVTVLGSSAAWPGPGRAAAAPQEKPAGDAPAHGAYAEPGKMPTSPVTLESVQVTAVPARTVKPAAAPRVGAVAAGGAACATTPDWLSANPRASVNAIISTRPTRPLEWASVAMFLRSLSVPKIVMIFLPVLPNLSELSHGGIA